MNEKQIDQEVFIEEKQSVEEAKFVTMGEASTVDAAVVEPDFALAESEGLSKAEAAPVSTSTMEDKEFDQEDAVSSSPAKKAAPMAARAASKNMTVEKAKRAELKQPSGVTLKDAPDLIQFMFTSP
jgi:hypothetical protein